MNRSLDHTTSLRIAIQKSGRLTDKTIDLLHGIGIEFDNYKRNLMVKTRNFDVELLLLRDDDIPEYVQDGVCDLGFVGANEVFEKLGVTIEMVEISGAVEITPQLHVADAISDLVSTGGTLKANGLVERFTILESETKLIQTQQALSEGKQQLIQKFLQRIDGYQTAKKSRYILMNAPLDSVETIKTLLPSMKSPTIMPLAETEMVAIHSVIPFDQFWDVMEQLQDAGASDIVMLPIESMIA